MLAWLARQSFVLLFLVVAVGYAIGRIKVRGIGLGSTASTLLIALGLSIWATSAGINLAIPDLVSTLFFNLFMFSVGMKVGPQFLSGLRRDGAKLLFFGLAIPAMSVGLLFLMRALVSLPPGLAPGILAGSNTATPGLGAAEAAYRAGAQLPGGVTVADALGNLSTGFTLSYCVSTVLFILFMRLPDLIGRDTAAAARRMQAELEGGLSSPLPGVGDEFLGRPLPVAVRSYAVEKPNPFVGHRLADLRRTYPRVAVERILRAGKLLDPSDDVVLQPHDTLALYGPVERLIVAASAIGPEVDVPEMRDAGIETAEVVVHRPEVARRTLLDLARDIGHGLFLNAIFRGGVEIPKGADLVVEKGDVLRVTGASWRIARFGRQAGRVVRASVATDIVTLALGLALGAAVGAVKIPLGKLSIAVGSAVGLLLVGIALSLLRTRHPALGGPFPEPARQLLEDLGLNVFIAVLGLNSGAGVVRALQGGALSPILIGCLVVGFIPPLFAWLVGAYGMKMNDALLLGAVAGGRCNSPGMRSAQEVTRSNIPALSYPVAFALANVILTVMVYVVAMIG